MKVGDLVRPADSYPATSAMVIGVTVDTIGIIVQWEPDYNEGEGCGWVKWNTRRDFTIEYENDLMQINVERTKEEKCSMT